MIVKDIIGIRNDLKILKRNEIDDLSGIIPNMQAVSFALPILQKKRVIFLSFCEIAVTFPEESYPCRSHNTSPDR